jgi:hypothetical protein
MWRSAVFIALGLVAHTANAQGSGFCWVLGASLSSSGEAVVTFVPQARGFVVILSAGASRPDTSFSLAPENTGSNGGNSTVTIPKGKEARLLQGHEACEFRWAEEGGHSGVRIAATSTYVPAGAAPSTAQAFVPFSRK